jgi:polyphosphate kinase
MPRNLDRRVEILFPLMNTGIIRRLRQVVLEKLLEDNRKARIGRPDGTYAIPQLTGEAKPFDSQAWFVQHRAD